MGLSLAYSNNQPYPAYEYKSIKNSVPYRSLRNSHIKMGTRVLVDRKVGKVVGYNISGFGMWVGALYPLVVKLNDGMVMRCKLCEIMPLPALCDPQP